MTTSKNTLENKTSKAATKLLAFFGKSGKRWTRHAYAIDEQGDAVPVNSRRAVQWCLAGAIQKLKIGPDIQKRFGNIIGCEWNCLADIPVFNDSHRTYTHVRKFLERVVKNKATVPAETVGHEA